MTSYWGPSGKLMLSEGRSQGLVCRQTTARCVFYRSRIRADHGDFPLVSPNMAYNTTFGTSFSSVVKMGLAESDR
jgi:hypothetical protein